jgi:lipoprotein-anchoring transpeptidase ErfK/SrfK
MASMAAGGLVVIVAAVSAFQGGQVDPAGGNAADKGAEKAVTRVVIAPRDGSSSTRPDRPITVQVSQGVLRGVTAITKSSGGTPTSAAGAATIEGTLSPDRTRWSSRETLAPSTRYEVVATAVGADGKPVTARSGFTTLKPKATIAASAAAPFNSETVGVGMPIILNFDRPVYNQAEVERALQVRASTPIEGAWRWAGRQQVIYRTKKYWRPQTKVTVTARMTGVRAARDVYGTRDLRLEFTVGDEHITSANEDRYTMTVKSNGKTVKRMPISMGRATKRAFTTTNGTHLTMEKAPRVIADSATVGIPKGNPDYYKIPLKWTVRISASGEYTHSAPWSVPDQGKRNVSHGCVNLSPANAKWFYDFSQRGDIYKITGTDRELEWNNGWGFWQLSWTQWKQGSALT